MTKAKHVKTEAPVVNDVLSTHGITFAGTQYTALEVADIAIQVQAHVNDLEVSKDSFGQQFILLAATCKTTDEFLTVMGAIEANKSWKSKQNPDGDKDAPKVWTQTKSNMKCAWENFEITPKMVKTTAELNEKLNAARKAAKAEKEGSADAGTTSSAIVEADTIDKSFSNLLVKLVKTYEALDETGRTDMFEAMATVYNQFNDTDSELGDLLESLPADVEVQQAAN